MYFSVIKMSHTAREDREFWDKTKEEYSLYSLFSELFYKESKEENKFIFRQEFGACYPSFFAVSEKKPDDNSEKWKIISNEYDPYFNKGDEFDFLIRFSPIIFKRESGVLLRYDCISDALEKSRTIFFSGREQFKKTDIIRKSALKWIKMKGFENGFSLISELFNADGYTDHKFTDLYGKNIEYNSIECMGKIKVTDTLKLKNALFYGIGDLKEFGTGMILIKNLL